MDVQFVDRILLCSDCHGEFVFTVTGEALTDQHGAAGGWRLRRAMAGGSRCCYRT